MGKRGPAPTPKATLKARGSKLADRKTTEPKPRVGRPRCPEWLDKTAKQKWAKLIPELERLGLLTIIDGDCLAAYCVAWSELRQATETLDKEGRVLSTPSGYRQPHPCVSMQRAALAKLKEFSALFGLDPSSRSRIVVPEKPAASDEGKSRFFKVHSA